MREKLEENQWVEFEMQKMAFFQRNLTEVAHVEKAEIQQIISKLEVQFEADIDNVTIAQAREAFDEERENDKPESTEETGPEVTVLLILFMISCCLAIEWIYKQYLPNYLRPPFSGFLFFAGLGLEYWAMTYRGIILIFFFHFTSSIFF